MDISTIMGVTPSGVTKSTAGAATATGKTSNMFDAILSSAIDNINTTNQLLSNAENEEIKFAMGESENTHDLMIALNKATTALQYTVAIRDKFLEAYKEIMGMQI